MPKFGELLPTDVWAAAARTLTNPSGVFSDATRTLTDISAEAIFDIPAIDANYVSGQPAASATPNTYGSWAEIVADVGASKRLIGIFVVRTGAGTPSIVEIQIGEGAAASEAVITRCYLTVPHVFAGAFVPLWKSLSDSARLSARVKHDTASADTYYIVVAIA